MNRQNISAELLSDIKNYLDITWVDDDTDNKIKNLIAGGSMYLDSKCAEELDYEVDGLPRTLLFDYVRYARDSALDVFENNFKSLILAMQNDRAVMKYAKGAIQTEK